MKNIIFMGTPEFAVETLAKLAGSEYTVQAVFTQPDKPRGRSGKLSPTPVKSEAVAHDIPVYQPARIRNPENLDILRQYAPDVIVVEAFGQIIPESILKLPSYGCVNVHASLLPKYRGAAPIQWAILDGETQTGVTTMQMNAGLDTGDMLLKTVIPIAPDDTGESLSAKLSRAGADLALETLRGLERGTITPVPQPAQSPTPYASMLTKQMGQIDWSRGADVIERQVRALNPWPSAYTRLDGKQLKIWKAGVIVPERSAVQAQPGTIVGVTKGRILVQTGDGVLSLESVQLEGKKRMDTDAFLRGFKVREGDCLG